MSKGIKIFLIAVLSLVIIATLLIVVASYLFKNHIKEGTIIEENVSLAYYETNQI